MKYKIAKLFRFFPLLHLYVELPFIRVRTVIMLRKYESQTIEYVCFHISVYKWEFKFSLHDKLNIEEVNV